MLQIWDTRTMKELSNFTGAQAPINCAAWHPVHEDVFVSGGHDGTVLLWLASRAGAQVQSLLAPPVISKHMSTFLRLAVAAACDEVAQAKSSVRLLTVLLAMFFPQ